MKTKITSPIVLIIFIVFFITNCDKREWKDQIEESNGTVSASVTTSSATEVTSNSATLGGNVSNDGESSVSERGICYGTSKNPTTSSNKIPMGDGKGSFSGTVDGLTSNTTYYVRAYAINKEGTVYGTEVSFTTGQAVALATVTTDNATNITSNEVSLGGNVTNNGGETVTERGICYSTTTNPTTANNKVAIGNGTGSFNEQVTGLTTNTTYYVRAYAITSNGTAYGDEISFTTSSAEPLDVPLNFVAIPGDKEVTLKWDTVTKATNFNIYWSTTPDVSKTNNTGIISDVAATSYLQTDLTPGTTYYYVVTAKNSNQESNESVIAKATVPLLFKTDIMSAEGEKHYYQVTVEAGQSLFLTTNIAGSYQKYFLYAKYGSLPTPGDYDAASATGDDEAISITNTQSGTYYIMVYASRYHSSYNGNYTFTASTSVIALPLETTYEATNFHEDEKDYYEVEVQSGENLLVNLHLFGSYQKYFLYVKYGSLPTAGDYDVASATGDDEAVSITDTQAGTYYIMVYTSRYHSSYDRRYEIKASLW